MKKYVINDLSVSSNSPIRQYTTEDCELNNNRKIDNYSRINRRMTRTVRPYMRDFYENVYSTVNRCRIKTSKHLYMDVKLKTFEDGTEYTLYSFPKVNVDEYTEIDFSEIP